MARKIYWLSESIGPLQERILQELHGEDAEIITDLSTFATPAEFAAYLQVKDGFVYALEHAGTLEVLAKAAKESGVIFGTIVGEYKQGSFRPTQVVWINYPQRNAFSVVWPGATVAHVRN